MNMKEAFDSYFLKLQRYYQVTYGTNPTVCYTRELNKSLFSSLPNDNGEVEWLPKLNSGIVSWASVERVTGFSLCQELKEYYSTYTFFDMTGKFGSSYLYFQPIGATEKVEITIQRQYHDAQYHFPNTEIFLLGNAIINHDDSYGIYYDNRTNKLFCYELDTKNQVLLSYSLLKTISGMEAQE